VKVETPGVLRRHQQVDRSGAISHVNGKGAIAETSPIELDSMINCTPGILGCNPCLRGHRIGVHRVAGWGQLGLAIEAIGEWLSSFTLAEIHVALTFWPCQVRSGSGICCRVLPTGQFQDEYWPSSLSAK
jgi:uncharacterized protein (DUF433 family)